ncbi:MAG TPA: VacJ family lipoprotein [Steroidobacteraceae bacterium]|jgi:phospholipid-binding lipoprotein MlaA|nr:VacJ family lipoprotein [Steroidobacteraceae bacterium]
MQKAFLALAALMLAGCATLPSGKPDPRDPLERFNRSVFAFNDALDKAVARPVAKAYVKVTPRIVRTGVSNVFNNLNTLGTTVNDVLQGKMRQAGHDSARFLLNSTLGLGGLFDPATAAGLELNDEDFGQTFGKWGVKSGPYLMLPFLGPSTFRDSVGRLADQFTYPVSYLEDDSTRIWIRAVDLLDMRAGLLDLDAQIDKSYDRYAFIRNAWLQRREFQVTDGNVEDSSLELEQGMEEEPAAGDQPPADAVAPAPSEPPAGEAPSAEPAPAPSPRQ